MRFEAGRESRCLLRSGQTDEGAALLGVATITGLQWGTHLSCATVTASDQTVATQAYHRCKTAVYNRLQWSRSTFAHYHHLHRFTGDSIIVLVAGKHCIRVDGTPVGAKLLLYFLSLVR